MSPTNHFSPLQLLFTGVAGIVISACQPSALLDDGTTMPEQRAPRGEVTGSPVALAPHTPGIHELLLPPEDLRFTLAIPDDYTPDRPVPLVLALHYGGTVTPFYGRGLLESLIEPALRELGAIIVAPDRAAGDWASPAGERQITTLLDTLEATYPVDRSRTLITGYSMGGMGTWYLAARNQDRFTAAIPMAGSPQSDTLGFEWHIPLYVIHSRSDEVVPLAPTEVAVSGLRDQGADITLVVVEGIPHFSVSSFVPPLAEAVPWIRRVWEQAR